MISTTKIFAAAIVLLGSSLSFAWSEPNRGDYRGGRVCFYENANYNGQAFCMNAGERNNNLAGFFNDRISSISIEGNLRVTVYRDANFSGGSAVLTDNQSNLSNRGLNDSISSIIVSNEGGYNPGPHRPPPPPPPVRPRPIPVPAPHPGPGPGPVRPGPVRPGPVPPPHGPVAPAPGRPLPLPGHNH